MKPAKLTPRDTEEKHLENPLEKWRLKSFLKKKRFILYTGPRTALLTMSLWTNGSSADLFAGTQPPPLGSNSSINGTNGSKHHDAAPLDLSRAVPVGMVLAFFIMFAIVGNIMVILSVVCNRHLRIPTNYFIINLAIADLLLGTTVLPVSATLEVSNRTVLGYLMKIKWRF